MNEPRTNSVTIMLLGQVMVTQEPNEKDHQFISLVIAKNREWVKDGKPLSNQGY